MELLERKIQEEGIALPGNVLKVDSFLNHQIDPELSLAMGREFARLFRDAGIDRVLMHEPVYAHEVYSFTKKETSEIIVLQKYLPAGENVLVIDDFLANGEAALGLASIVEEAGSKVAGIGIAIEKAFQRGHQRIIDKGYHLEALASIASLDDGKITIVEK